MNLDPKIHVPAAEAFTKYEVGSSFHEPFNDFNNLLNQERFVLGLARTEAHYFIHKFFLVKIKF